MTKIKQLLTQRVDAVDVFNVDKDSSFHHGFSRKSMFSLNVFFVCSITQQFIKITWIDAFH